MTGYPNASFPTALDTLNQVGPEGGSVQAPNTQGETHAGIHAQLAAILTAIETVIGITGSADTSSIMYRLGLLGGQAGLGQGARNVAGGSSAIAAADRGYVVFVQGGAAITVPTTPSLGNGFVFALSNVDLTGLNSVITFTAPSGFWGPWNGGGVFITQSTITLRPGESITIMGANGLWMAIGGSGVYSQPTAVIPNVFLLSDQATIATNAAHGNIFSVTLAASRAMAAPTNPSNGQKIEYVITQGGTGSYVITWDPIFHAGATVALPTLSTAVGARDRITFEYNEATTQWDLLAYALGF